MQSYIVYDFDGTIYNGDSSVDFFKYCLLKYPHCWLCIPKILIAFFKYGIKKIKKKELKEIYFCFLRYIPDIDEALKAFWEKNRRNIKEFFLEEDLKRVIVITASPEFLIEPICTSIGVTNLIASRVDSKTGKFIGENCRGEEKRRMLFEAFGECRIERFYSDSLSDAPLAAVAESAFIVKGNQIFRWKGLER